jgi:hypothetical protein
VVPHQLHRAIGAKFEVPGGGVRLSALGLRREQHGSVKQIHHEELEDGNKERPNRKSNFEISGIR